MIMRTLFITSLVLLFLSSVSASKAEDRFETITLKIVSDIVCCPIYNLSVKKALKKIEGIKNFYSMTGKGLLTIAYYPDKIGKEKIIKIIKKAKGMRYFQVKEVVKE